MDWSGALTVSQVWPSVSKCGQAISCWSTISTLERSAKCGLAWAVWTNKIQVWESVAKPISCRSTIYTLYTLTALHWSGALSVSQVWPSVGKCGQAISCRSTISTLERSTKCGLVWAVWANMIQVWASVVKPISCRSTINTLDWSAKCGLGEPSKKNLVFFYF